MTCIADDAPPGKLLYMHGLTGPAVPHVVGYSPDSAVHEVTILSSFSILLAQGQLGAGDFLTQVREMGLVGQFVLAMLVLFSLGSWAIIIYKGLALKRAHAESETFLEIFRKSNKFSEVNSLAVQLKA